MVVWDRLYLLNYDKNAEVIWRTKGTFNTATIVGLCFGGLLLLGKKNLERYGFAVGCNNMIEEIYIDNISDLTRPLFSSIMQLKFDKLPSGYEDIFITGLASEQYFIAVQSSNINEFMQGFNTMCNQLPHKFHTNDIACYKI